MKSSFLPKYERKIVKISALYSEAHYRATTTSEIYWPLIEINKKSKKYLVPCFRQNNPIG